MRRGETRSSRCENGLSNHFPAMISANSRVQTGEPCELPFRDSRRIGASSPTITRLSPENGGQKFMVSPKMSPACERARTLIDGTCGRKQELSLLVRYCVSSFFFIRLRGQALLCVFSPLFWGDILGVPGARSVFFEFTPILPKV